MSNTENQALGMIEVVGRIGAIEALDASLKAANVRFVNLSKVGGGLTAIFVEGEVGAVKAAVTAGGAAAERVSTVVSVHVIPRPAGGIPGLSGGDVEPFYGSNVTKVKGPAPKRAQPKPAAKKTEQKPDISLEEAGKLNVSKLRTLARSIEGFPMKRTEITYAKRADLMKALEAFLTGEDKA